MRLWRNCYWPSSFSAVATNLEGLTFSAAASLKMVLMVAAWRGGRALQAHYPPALLPDCG